MNIQAGKMVQQVKALATQWPTRWMERTYSYKLSSDFYMHAVVCMCNFNKFSWHSEGKNRNFIMTGWLTHI